MSTIIDTNVLIEIENNNQEIIKYVDSLKDSPNSEVYLTFFTLCEFYYGIIKKNAKNKAKALEQIKKYPVLSNTNSTAIIFAEILFELNRKGKQIPLFDVMIAAIAKENGLLLVTGDNHFKEIPGIKLRLVS